MTIATLSSNDWLRREARLAEARAGIRADPGTYSNLTVLGFCGTLMDDGDALDWRNAQLVRAAVLSQVEADQPLFERIADVLAARPLLATLLDALGVLILFGLTFAALVIFGG